MYYSVTSRDNTATLSVIGDGIDRVIASTHPNYDALVTYLGSTTEHDTDVVSRLIDPGKVVSEILAEVTDRITYFYGDLYFDGAPLEPLIARHILDRINRGDEDWQALVKFLINLDENPSMQSREHLFHFLSKHGLTITRDGNFIAYKGVTDERFSLKAGPNVSINGVPVAGARTIEYQDGSVVSMPRSKVDDNRNEACSAGLHVGNFTYAAAFGQKLLLVEVNPRDVVAVPSDSDDQKVRVCELKVVCEWNLPEYEGTTYYVEFEDVRVCDYCDAEVDAFGYCDNCNQVACEQCVSNPVADEYWDEQWCKGCGDDHTAPLDDNDEETARAVEEHERSEAYWGDEWLSPDERDLLDLAVSQVTEEAAQKDSSVVARITRWWR